MAAIKQMMRAYLTNDGAASNFVDALRAGNQAEALNCVNFGPEGMDRYGWTFIGMAEVSLDVQDDDTIRQNMVQALREQKKTVLAEAQLEATRIDEKIQNLLAISFDATP